MRAIGVLASVLFLSVLAAGAPLEPEYIPPKTAFAIGRLTNDHTVVSSEPLLPADSTLSDQIPPSFESGCLAGDFMKGLPLGSVVKSIRPIRHLKDAHAEVVIYLQDVSGLPIDTT
ncbi:hypothetical protein F5I97DRAFT_1347874 [Phlebopus sp. FC_14]|nr:hypothetical protein F5I97DRAFT_1347874 [Phlebopus sp. FC_14]